MASQNSSKWQPLMARNRGANLLVLWSSWNLPNSAWCFGTMEFYVPFHIWDVILPIDELHHFSRWLSHHQPAILFHSFFGFFLAHGIMMIMMIMKNVRIMGSSPMNPRLNVLGVRFCSPGGSSMVWSSCTDGCTFWGGPDGPEGPEGPELACLWRLWVINHWHKGW